ncbi:MAG: DNA gyrase subunit A [Christensenellales bacterium]|jgi:DNA gyrase subunit A
MSENSGTRLLTVDLESEMKKSFIAYSMAVIINRALPDVRDGLKPVHRRILYDMAELGMWPDKPFRKSARIVGDCLGKYHPHGDSSVYDAMVRLAQDFSTRYPLVEGHGNFGSVDGDGAAAMRYTEARLSKLAAEMLRDLDKDTVDFGPNFDESLTQPLVLPSRFPNLLVNGSNGIAVGMATNIPPHNLGEVIDACVAMIEDPEITTEELITLIPGPDFPTGGIIMGMSGIREAYRTGRGRIVVRAKTEIEEMSANRSRIVVTEIPYQVNKANLVSKIAELVHDKRVEGISDLRDESGREGMRIVIELKAGVNPSIVLNTLFKHTQMQYTFGVISIALVDGEPKVLSLHQMLRHYLDHQKDVVTRRTRFELNRAEARAHILEGLLIALDNIDEVVHIIRSSATAQEARNRLTERFGLSDKQTQAILDMRLQRLVGLERERLEAEYAELQKTIAYLRSLLADEALIWGVVKDELMEIRKRFADPRRTEISPVFDEIEFEDLIEEENMVVTLTHFGYIKRTSADTYRMQRRGGKGIAAAAIREDDVIEHLFAASTHSEILFFTNKGRVFSMKCYQIPEAGRTAKGTAIVNLLQLGDGEKVTNAFPATEGKYLAMCTKGGIIKKTELKSFENIRKVGLIAVNLRDDDELISVIVSEGDDEFIVATRNGKCIRFSERDVRPMGRTATGVKAIHLEEGDEVVSLEKVMKGQQVLAISELGIGKRTSEEEYRLQGRGGKGIAAMNITEKTGLLCALHVINGDEDVMLIRSDGTIIRLHVAEMREISRNTQGVKLMQVNDEDVKVVAACITEHEEDAEVTAVDNSEIIDNDDEQEETQTESVSQIPAPKEQE